MPTHTADRPARTHASPAAARVRAAATCAPASPRRALSADFVRRPDLVDRLIAAPHASLALIVAPPGYGKTALLTEWSERDQRPFAWVTFDGSTGADAEAARAVIASAIRKAGGSRGSFVLVLDEAHLARPDVLGDVVTSILGDLPERALLALATRTEPALPAGRLRAQRTLVEIRMHDLAMDPAEAAQLLDKTGLDLDADSVRTLVGVTEGWPAALYLVALSLREQPDVHAAVSCVRGDDHFLAAYLRDEVLGGLSPKLLRFATRTSVLDELSGPFCDAVLETHGTATTLTQLEQLSQLLVPLDASHSRFRWHSLLRETLTGELRRREPEVETRLHLIASAWYERNGDLDAAIGHGVAAGDARRVGDLLWPRILGYATSERNELVQTWMSGFSHAEIAAYPPLAMCAAQSALAMGRVTEAQQWRLEAACGLDAEDLVPGPRSMQAGLALTEALGARVGAARMATAATRAYELEPEGSPWRPVSCLVRGVAEYLEGRGDRAESLLEEGADLGAAREPAISALCFAELVAIAIDRRDWELAVDLADEADRLLTEHHLRDAPMAALVFASMAAARAHQARADEAKRDLRQGIERLAALGDFVPWYAAEARILLAYASLWLADVVGARTLLAEASRFARRIPDAVVFQHWFDDAWAYMDTLAETSLTGASSLTIAELRILRFLPSHRSFREIGAQLGVSANTVKTQAHAIYRKLGAASRSEAVARASEAGLLGQ